MVQKKLVVMPFKDDTGFRGEWNIEREIPAYLCKSLAANPLYEIVPMDSVYREFKGQRVPDDPAGLSRMGEALGADVVVTGQIDDFNVSRFGLGSPMVGGYQAFSAEVDVRATLTRVIDAKALGTVGGKGEVKDRSAAMTLMGKPTQRDDEFFGLDTIVFGSDEFRQTIIGEACDKALAELGGKIDGLIGRPKLVSGRVLLADSQAVYLNVGFEDGLQLGDKLGVYVKGKEITDPESGEVLGCLDDERVGTVQIIELRAEHFSKAKVIEGGGGVTADDLVKTEPPGVQEK